MFESFIHVFSLKSSSSFDVSEFEIMDISPTQDIPLETTPYVPKPQFSESHKSEDQNNLRQPEHQSQPDPEPQPKLVQPQPEVLDL